MTLASGSALRPVVMKKLPTSYKPRFPAAKAERMGSGWVTRRRSAGAVGIAYVAASAARIVRQTPGLGQRRKLFCIFSTTRMIDIRRSVHVQAGHRTAHRHRAIGARQRPPDR